MPTVPEFGLIRFSNIGHAYTHLFMMLYPTVVLALEITFDRPYGELLTLSVGGYIMFGVGALPAGWLADRWSALGMMSVFFLGLGVSAILTGFARSPLEIAGGLALIGLFASIYHPVGTALIVRNPARRGRTLGINGMFGGIGTGTAALLAGVLIDLASWRAAFIVPGVFSLLTGMVFVVFIRGRRLQDFAHTENSSSGRDTAAVIRIFALLFVITLCTGFIYQTLSVALPKILVLRTESLTGGMTDVGGKVTVIFLVAGLMQILVGHLADRYSQKPIFLMGYLVMIPVLLTAASLFGLPFLLMALVVVSINVGMLPVTDSIFTAVTPVQWRSTIFGAKFVVSLGVSATGIPLVGMIFDQTGSFNLLFTALALVAAIVVLSVALLPIGNVPAPQPAPEASGGA